MSFDIDVSCIDYTMTESSASSLPTSISFSSFSFNGNP